MATPIVLHRWKAVITYRSDTSYIKRNVSFEEIEELHDIVEKGPNFYTIESIVITLNDRVAPMTIEESEVI